MAIVKMREVDLLCGSTDEDPNAGRAFSLCQECRGAGALHDVLCERCNGKGFVYDDEQEE